MQKVQMTVHGREALVDADMVKLMTKKAELVAAAAKLRESAGNMTAAEHLAVLDEVVGKIIRLNRRIRKNVQFI